MLTRTLLTELIEWKSAKSRKPLMVRGARQVGKSYLVETFGQSYFKNIVTINFELSPEYKACFTTLKPTEICDAIQVLSQQPIVPGDTLLFLDEIQDCPEAIQALRYFKEQLPQLHVISAGSLLELGLKKSNFRMPVGRIESLFLYPLSFAEYLAAASPVIDMKAYLSSTSLSSPLAPAVHEHLLKILKTYLLLGGMPEVVSHYLSFQDIQAVQKIQASIIETYKQDFGHYSMLAHPKYLDTCFERVPLMIGQQIKYNKIDADSRSRDLKDALFALEAASVVQRVYATKAQGLPLDASINDKKFKMNFIDVGLVKRFNQLDASLLLEKDIMLLNQGALAEQFVGQELLVYSKAYEKQKLYFWARDGYATAEVDYLKVIGHQIFPIEVKSGKSGTLRSLKQYLIEHDIPFGIRISQQPLSFENNVLTIPLYLISELDRLVQEKLF